MDTGLPELGLKKRLICGVAWNLIATLASRGSTLVAMVIVARVLGKTQYGELGVIQSTISMFGTFAGMGLGVTSTRYIAKLRATDPLRVGRIIALTHALGWLTSGALASLLFVLAPFIANGPLSNPSLTNELQWAALLLHFSSITGVQVGTLAGFEAFKSLGRVGIIQGILSFPVIIAGVYMGGLRGAVVGMGVAQVLGYLLNLHAIRQCTRETSIDPCYRTAWRETTVLKQTAIPSMLVGIMAGPVVWWGNAVIANEPEGYAQLGSFNAVNQWKVLFTFLPAIIGSVLLPILSNTESASNKRLESVNLLGNWIIVTAAALLLMVFPGLISMLYGPEYAGTEFNRLFALMMMVSIILAYKEGIARKLIVGELLWWGMLSNFVWGIFFILAVYFYRESGASGLALAYILSYILNTVIFVPFYLRRKVISKELLASSTVLMSWVAITAVLLSVVYGRSLILSCLALVFAYYMLWITFKKFLIA